MLLLNVQEVAVLSLHSQTRSNPPSGAAVARQSANISCCHVTTVLGGKKSVFWYVLFNTCYFKGQINTKLKKNMFKNLEMDVQGPAEVMPV